MPPQSPALAVDNLYVTRLSPNTFPNRHPGGGFGNSQTWWRRAAECTAAGSIALHL